MQLLDKHKAIIITALLTGTVVLGLFSLHLTKKSVFIAESVFEIEPKTEEEILKELQELNNANTASTNKAVNEDQEFKDLMKNFKMVSSNDFEKTTKAIEDSKTDVTEQELTTNSALSSTNNTHALKESETEAYNKLKELLKKKADTKTQADEHAKGGSTLTYSLKDRVLLNYNTPRYLCERSGKIVVNVKVNGKGKVFDAYINGSSNSDNECLTNHAIEYAKAVRFNTANRIDQLGSITFYFKGKD